MQSGRLWLAAVALTLSAGSAVARGSEGLPPGNLLIELRWVRAAPAEAPADPSRTAPVVVATGGAGAAPRATTVSTASREPVPGAIQRLLVVNGQSASASLDQPVPVQWVETFALAPAAAASGPGQGARAGAAMRTQWVNQVRSFAVSAHWPGGQAPVRVEIKAAVPRGSQAAPAQAEVFTTVQVVLGEWRTVAYDGASVPRPQAGAAVSTRATEPRSARELQLRVSLAP